MITSTIVLALVMGIYGLGIIMIGQQEEGYASVANPYCDQVTDEYMESGGTCHDRKDYSDDTGLYPCNDGTEKERWQDCKDVSGHGEDDD